MTNNTSFIQFQPITVLQGHNKQQQPRRTPSPADTAATISESFSTTTSNNAMNMMMYTTTVADEYSPIPGGLDASSQSSPGSASDHMGVIPNTVASHGTDVHVQPLFPGSSVLAAFDAGNPNLAYGQHPLPPQKQINPSLPLSSTSSGGVTVKSPVLARRKNGSGGGSTAASGRAATAKASSATTTNSNSSSAGAQPGNTNRRQSRLQRNRESARLSRKRRKQYLELLEERVDKLSETLDGSRRQHVASAVATLNQKRIEYILQHNNNATGVATPGGNDATVMRMLENNLSRTNEELMIATTFQYQQLKSFSIPPSMQFTLWLTLQTDTYFRGGRTASERLSAARIGERMLSSGTESAAPSQSMWPLFCNEIGLSYDQEEKLRAMQRTLIQDHSTWVDRHTAYASRKVIESAHVATQALTFRAGQRERSTLSHLSNDQRMKIMKWTLQNRDRVAHSTATVAPAIAPQRDIHPQYHVAANLYILNEQLQHVLLTVPPAAPLLTGAALKRLSHRPSFEPLGASDERSNEMCRDGSYPSSGSLKRNASEMSMDGDDSSNCVQKAQVPAISPVDAQATAVPTVQQALNMVLDLLPPEPPMESMMTTNTEEHQQQQQQQRQNCQVDTPIDELVYSLDIPLPEPVVSSSLEIPPITSIVPSLIYQAPAAYTQSAPSFGALQPPHAQQHVRKSSFLPAHLSVVPEELWPDEADEFLLDMIEGDWAIGEGIDMDMNE